MASVSRSCAVKDFGSHTKSLIERGVIMSDARCAVKDFDPSTAPHHTASDLGAICVALSLSECAALIVETATMFCFGCFCKGLSAIDREVRDTETADHVNLSISFHWSRSRSKVPLSYFSESFIQSDDNTVLDF